MIAVEARPFERGDIVGLAALFESADARCFCQYWHFEGDKNEWLARCFPDPIDNRVALAKQASQGELEGVVAVERGTIVGWAKLAFAETLPKPYGQRFYRALPCFRGDRSGVALLSCMLVHPSHRRRGVSRRLVVAAIARARAMGAHSLEVLPRRVDQHVADEELWTTPFSGLGELGFVEVDGEGPYPVMRLTLGSASLTDETE